MSNLADLIKEAIVEDYCDSCDALYSVHLEDSYIGGDKFHTWLDEIVIRYIEDLDEYEIIEFISNNLRKRGDRVQESLFEEMTSMYAVKKKLAELPPNCNTSP
tara:strand:+ start:469 stop:777 length:309 start_codon:yes stop_codon:yes gene_type:complete